MFEEEERRKVAEILQIEFPKWTVSQIEKALKKFEEFDLDGAGILGKFRSIT